ncbi:ABC transporter ATP-binding protein [Cellulomonas sp. S1-8]|uniref:ABC transporter ATP-binding protein n=1 Tax=Cellulomonas sp. S1-8 TaxID=2904790 RepID=UPI0022436485|nr:ABC transporter ATP-binding protein [Cellulomonas sp. S1-8]UZN04157.1 ABC transporter ATP-binding protein [Cellulomonas sp. S1-8]
MSDQAPDELLVVRNLSGGFRNGDELTPVLDDVSLSLRTSRLTAIVGETGSGKSVTALAILGLLPPQFERTQGSIELAGIDLCGLGEKQLRGLRGSRIAMVFQDARAALNPVLTVGRQLMDACRAHRDLSSAEARSEAENALRSVQVPEPRQRMKQYPHEFSGGMAQRVMLALALICEPELLILDEPTTGLDVTIQADIMDLIVELTRTRGLTACLITHDLGVVAETCDDVVVMYRGRVRETGSCHDILTRPQDAYTQALVASSRFDEVVR